jgi:hypothetical protein
MSRIRTVKPEWLEDERLSLASPLARVMSIALITLADDEGRGRGNATMLGGRVFPGSANPREESARALAELVSARYVVLYEVDGQSYFQIRNWTKHQKVDKPTPSRLPEPPPEAEPITSIIPTTLAPLANPRESSRDVGDSSGMFQTDLGPRTVDQDLGPPLLSGCPPPPGPDKPDPVRQVFAAWLEEHVEPGQRSKCKLNAKRKVLIRSRLREYPPERLIAAIRGVKLSSWHMGENADGKRYTGLQTILRDGEQVEKFEAMLTSPPKPRGSPGGMRAPSPDSHFTEEGDSPELFNRFFSARGANDA